MRPTSALEASLAGVARLPSSCSALLDARVRRRCRKIGDPAQGSATIRRIGHVAEGSATLPKDRRRCRRALESRANNTLAPLARAMLGGRGMSRALVFGVLACVALASACATHVDGGVLGAGGAGADGGAAPTQSSAAPASGATGGGDSGGGGGPHEGGGGAAVGAGGDGAGAAGGGGVFVTGPGGGATCGDGGSPGSTGPGGSPGAGGATSGAGGAQTCADTSCDPDNCGAPGHSCLGGACVAGACQPLTLMTGTAIDHIAMDATNVYASVTLEPSCGVRSAIAAYPRSPGPPRVLFETFPSDVLDVTWLTVDDASVFWWSRSTAHVYSLSTQGGLPFQLDGHNVATHFAVDDTSVYFAHQHGVFRMNRDGTAPAQIATTGTRCVVDLVQDDARIYFSACSCNEGGNHECMHARELDAVPKVGGPVSVVASHGLSVVFQLTERDGYLYWNDDDESIQRVATSGGAVETVVSVDVGATGGLGSFAVDATDLYTLTFGAGGAGDMVSELARTPLSGGATTILATPPSGGLGLLVDDRAIVFSTLTDGFIPVPADYALYLLAK
jgi:hypothetical protein